MSTLDVTNYGASPSNSDNTVMIQVALDAAQPGDTVRVPAGDFWIDGTKSVLPRTGTTFQIDGNLKVIPSAAQQPIAVLLRNVSSVTVTGAGKVIGDRYSALKPSPQSGIGRHGYGIAVFEGSSNINIMGLELREHYADGLYVQGATNTNIKYNHCLDNARNGLSIIAAQKLIVTGNVFGNTHSESPYPQAGIDIEPDLPTQVLLDVSISGNSFTRNKGAGVYIGFPGGATNRARVFVVNNDYDQHYKDGSGPKIGGRNTPLGNFLYAAFRWVPGYDWWAFPSDFTLS
jgi:hypothetical protein